MADEVDDGPPPPADPKPRDPEPARRKAKPKRKGPARICDSCATRNPPRAIYCCSCGVRMVPERKDDDDAGSETTTGTAAETPPPRDKWDAFWGG